MSVKRMAISMKISWMLGGNMIKPGLSQGKEKKAMELGVSRHVWKFGWRKGCENLEFCQLPWQSLGKGQQVSRPAMKVARRSLEAAQGGGQGDGWDKAFQKQKGEQKKTEELKRRPRGRASRPQVEWRSRAKSELFLVPGQWWPLVPFLF